MTINTEAAEPAAIPGSSRQAGEEKRRQRVVMLVMAATAARMAVDRRTLAGVIVIAIAVVASKNMTQERGFPVLRWYQQLGRDESPDPT